MRVQLLLITTVAVLGCVCQTNAEEFYEYPDEFDSVTVIYPDDIGGPFYAESNLIQGAGVGFDEDEPHDALLFGAAGAWVTTADCGFPCDYIEGVGMPVIELDLGQDVLLDEISTWGYADTNTNGMREFELRFATDAEGTAGFGTSITYNPTFIVEDFFEFTAAERRSFEFSEQVTARWVEMTVTDNYFDDPGDGTGDEGWGPGGDRVGIGEIAFRVPTATAVPGDYNGNGERDLADIDALTQAISTGATDSKYDLNGDGSVNADDRGAWVVDLTNTYFGDSNFDGEFGSGDFVTVFTAAKYETGLAAGWGEGDWNGDGVFGSSDLVTAFIEGGFEKGARAGGLMVVPEPSSIALALIGVVAFFGIRRK
jgi:hypothetical protein